MFMREKILWLPTGFGKSVCYETFPFVFNPKERSNTSCSSANCSVVLGVSPLVSLMVDHLVESLRKRCVKAAILSGHDGVPKELQGTQKDLRSSKLSMLFSSPEAIPKEAISLSLSLSRKYSVKYC